MEDFLNNLLSHNSLGRADESPASCSFSLDSIDSCGFSASLPDSPHFSTGFLCKLTLDSGLDPRLRFLPLDIALADPESSTHSIFGFPGLTVEGSPGGMQIAASFSTL